MIITGIINLIVGVFNWILSLIPSMKINIAAENQDSLFEVINGVSCIVPVKTAGILVGIVLIVYGFELIWHLVNWLIAKIPFID